VIQYKVIRADTFEELAVRVSAALNDHWSAVGGICWVGGDKLLCQAVQKGCVA
jgi:hypothetical protein